MNSKFYFLKPASLPLHRHLNPSSTERDSITSNCLHVGMAFYKALDVLAVFDLLQSDILERE